jgi:hypothetical protein
MADATPINPAYAALGTIAGAFITALYGTLRLIGEKETKVSEFRQAWVASFRNALTEYVAAVHIIAGRISIREKHHTDGQERKKSYPDWPDLLGKGADLSNKAASTASLFDREFESELLPHWASLRKAFNAVILHLNPHEHAAYLEAEKKFSVYNKEAEPLPGEKEEDTERRQAQIVEDYLTFCRELIDVAEHISSQNLLHHQKAWDSKFAHKLLKCRFGLPCGIGPYADEVGKRCQNSADALLLALVTTRDLLQGTYREVNSRRDDIEKGINVIDSAGSLVIKEVWEQIKRGETRFQVFIAVGVSIAIFAAWGAYQFLF